MNCEEVEKQLTEFLDKSLGVQSTKDLDGHLNACPRCSAELASLAEFQRLVTDLPAVEPPAGFTARVMAQVQVAGRRSGIWKRLFFCPAKDSFAGYCNRPHRHSFYLRLRESHK